MEIKTVGDEVVTRLREVVTVVRDGAAGAEPVGVLARKQVASVGGRATLSEVIDALVGNDVGAVLVRDDDRSGIISERDVIDALHDGADPGEVWAADVMRAHVISVTPETTIAEAGTRMLDEGIRHLVIDGADPGIVSMRDVLGRLLR